MYGTCISCYASLGSNEVLERLPVGRLIAFDSQRGRLWVVCRACRCWNLVPLEERWEAVEEAAERFRVASRRVNSDEISLAFHNDGAGLLHVGRVTLPEFAAWRYGSKLLRHRDRFRRSARAEAGAVGLGAGTSLAIASTTASLGAAPLAIAAAALVGVPAAVVAWSHLAQRRAEKPLCWLFAENGLPQRVSVMGGTTAELIPGTDSGRDWTVSILDFDGRRQFEGHSAWRVLAAVLSHHNPPGARSSTIRAAVAHIEEAGESHAFLNRIARSTTGPVSRLTPAVRLGLEISLHEASERKALAGDLADLTDDWRQAELVAEIADNLLRPDSLSGKLEQLRRTRRASSGT